MPRPAKLRNDRSLRRDRAIASSEAPFQRCRQKHPHHRHRRERRTALPGVVHLIQTRPQRVPVHTSLDGLQTLVTPEPRRTEAGRPANPDPRSHLHIHDSSKLRTDDNSLVPCRRCFAMVSHSGGNPNIRADHYNHKNHSPNCYTHRHANQKEIERDQQSHRFCTCIRSIRNHRLRVRENNRRNRRREARSSRRKRSCSTANSRR